MGFSFWLWQHASHLPSGYASDERSSLDKRGERCRWQMKRPERSAAVDKIEEKRKPKDFIGHRKPGCRNDPEKPFGKESTGDPNKGDTQNQTLYMSVTKANTTPASATKLRNAGILVIPAFFRVLGYNAKNSDANN